MGDWTTVESHTPTFGDHGEGFHDENFFSSSSDACIPLIPLHRIMHHGHSITDRCNHQTLERIDAWKAAIGEKKTPRNYACHVRQGS